MKAKELNKKLFEENIELFVNEKKNLILKEIKVKFKFNKILNRTSFMFYKCHSLKSIDIFNFYTTKVTN